MADTLGSFRLAQLLARAERRAVAAEALAERRQRQFDAQRDEAQKKLDAALLQRAPLQKEVQVVVADCLLSS